MSELNRKQTPAPVFSPETQRLALLCARAAIDKKAVDTLVLNVGHRGSFTDFFVISSGNNERQVQAMADEVLKQARSNGQRPKMEGYDQGRWILIDMGDVVVHLFHEALRDFYHLEDLWAGAPRLPIPQDYYTSGSLTPTSPPRFA